MAKKKHTPENEPAPNPEGNAGAFLETLRRVHEAALARTIAKSADKEAGGAQQVGIPDLSEEEIDQLIQHSEFVFPWLRARDKFTAKTFISEGHYQDFESDMAPERFAAFQRKEPPTTEELVRFNQLRYDRIMADGGSDIDLDVNPMCSASYYKLPNGQKKLLMICGMGYSFTSVRHWVEGVFDTEEELWAYVNDSWTKE